MYYNHEISRRVAAFSENHVINLLACHNMRPGDIIRQYTGIDTESADLRDAIDCVSRFNLDMVSRYGVLPD